MKQESRHFSDEKFKAENYKRKKNNGFFVKVDVKKYFSYISHTILKEKLKKLIIPEDVLSLLHAIIDSYQSELDIGLPMGNQTSQAFALFYLNDIDKAIKGKYRIRY